MNINIAFCIDNNYVRHLTTTLSSLFQNTACSNYHIFIFSLNVSPTNKKNISSWASAFCKIEFIDVTDKSVKDFPIQNNSSISLATYLRLFIPSLLPENIKKILYIDSDTLILSNIDALYNIDISNYALAAMEDVNNKEFLRLAPGIPYFNAGVILFNLSFLRKLDFTINAINFISENKNLLKYYDQDVLNALLGKDVLLIPLKWNMLDCFYWDPPYIQNSRRKDLTLAKKDPAIIHFSGIIKPWHYFSNHPYTKKYRSYTPNLELFCSNDSWDHFKRIPSYQKILLSLMLPRKIYYFLNRLAVNIWNALHD